MSTDVVGVLALLEMSIPRSKLFDALIEYGKPWADDLIDLKKLKINNGKSNYYTIYIYSYKLA